MSQLFLHSVELSNFRIYGDSYVFRLPKGPGVTLITGGNGLGKTSFFDGVEWALTNRVGRFDDMPMDGRRRNMDPLTRIGAPEGSHRVSLAFSDGSVIDRGAGFEAPETDIVRLLKRPEWAEISSLHGYLSITHFFGQASAQRFSLKKPTDQWEALKGPAGVDRINTLRERLGGVGVKRAFTRAIEDQSAKLDQATADLAAWELLVEERDRARQLASSERAISPPDLRVEVDKLATRVVAATGRDTWTLSSHAEAPEALLDALSGLLQSAKDRNRAALGRIDELSRLVDSFASARAEGAAVELQVRATEARLLSLREALRSSDEAVAEAGAVAHSREADAGRANGRLIALRRVSVLSGQLEEALERHLSQQNQLTAVEAASTQIADTCQQLRLRHSEALAQRSERRALAERLSRARTRVRVFSELEKVLAELAHFSEAVGARSATELRAKRSQLSAEAEGAGTHCASLVARLQAHDDRSRAIAEAVGAIAHRLNHGDMACPVCSTAFPPGELLRLVREQAEERASPASTLATELAEARFELERLNRQIVANDIDLATVEKLEASLGHCASRASELRQQLVDAGGSADAKYDERDTAAIERDLERLDEELAAKPDPEDVAVLIAEAEAAIAAEAAKRAAAMQLLAGTSDEIQSIRSAMLQHPGTRHADTGLLVDLPAEIEKAEDDARSAGELLSAANTAAAEARLRQDSLRADETHEVVTLSALRDRAVHLVSEQQAARDHWSATGQDGDPDQALLGLRRHTVGETSNKVQAIDAAFQELVTRYRKWREDELLRKLEQDVLAKVHGVGAASELECHARLAILVDLARKDLSLVQSTKQKVDEVGANMQKLARTYATGVLAPLNVTIQRFARTLMTWSDTAVTYSAEHHKTGSELRPKILRSELNGTVSQLDINPGHYFSEGQLSALSVAALLAASTTFGWSRWRGLLLDDPLQHNDVIHASAFMDLLRQMVHGLGYQIVMSTHDSSEAEFLSRKCRSAGIPYAVHELAPQGPAGLVTPEIVTSRWAQA